MWPPRVAREAARMEWGGGAARVGRKVRAFAIWPRVRVECARGPLLLLRAREGGPAAGQAPGTVGPRRGDRLLVACGDGRWLEVLQVQPAGKRPMSAAAALAGRYLEQGEVLGDSPP